ncbi:MAG TPA: hypothetical protein VJB15_12655 [Rhodothermia bacterium]|nr:hypothetical protein [Rhodothermia bacterium]
MHPSVTIETKCWENDWELVLKTDRIQRVVESCAFDFARKTLVINNVRSPRKVCAQAERLVKSGVLSDFHLVADHEDEALDFFELTKAALGAGYVYSIAELVGIYLCSTQFLLHFSGDSMPMRAAGWIDAALQRFGTDPRVKVANLTWNKRYAEAKSEAFAEDDDFYIGYGFSDQMYLVRTADFRSAAVYHEKHDMSARYPEYGGELFEKRTDSWMRNHQFVRLTYKHGSYEHRNFPQSNAGRKLALITARMKALAGNRAAGFERKG